MTERSTNRRDLLKTAVRGGLLAALAGVCAAVVRREPYPTDRCYTNRCDGCPIESDCELRVRKNGTR